MVFDIWIEIIWNGAFSAFFGMPTKFHWNYVRISIQFDYRDAWARVTFKHLPAMRSICMRVSLLALFFIHFKRYRNWSVLCVLSRIHIWISNQRRKKKKTNIWIEKSTNRDISYWILTIPVFSCYAYFWIVLVHALLCMKFTQVDQPTISHLFQLLIYFVNKFFKPFFHPTNEENPFQFYRNTKIDAHHEIHNKHHNSLKIRAKL